MIVAESAHPEAPLSGDAGRLLDNMLRAMQLHRHPRVPCRPSAVELQAQASDDIPSRLADTVATLQLGAPWYCCWAMWQRVWHWAAPNRWGTCAGPHTVAGCPAVVTYDPAFLLRSQDAKAAAWVDLCRALAIVRNAAPA